MSVLISRGVGHPWTSAPGWDQMLLTADSVSEMNHLVQRAREKFWKLWYGPSACGDGRHMAHMFKPSDATRDWEDVSWQGTPRGHGHQFKVGDKVYTDFSGRITNHEVTAIEFRKISQTGVMLRVRPTVPGSGFRSDDPGGGPARDFSPPIDAAWFRKVEP